MHEPIVPQGHNTPTPQWWGGEPRREIVFRAAAIARTVERTDTTHEGFGRTHPTVENVARLGEPTTPLGVCTINLTLVITHAIKRSSVRIM